MDLATYDLRDPARFVADVAERIDLTENTATLCLIKHPSTVQELVAVHRLRHPAVLDGYETAREELYEMIQSWDVPSDGPPEHLAITVLARRGRCVFTRSDSPWFDASRYCNHLAAVYGPHELLVTEHGWQDFMTGHAGLTPTLSDESTQVALT